MQKSDKKYIDFLIIVVLSVLSYVLLYQGTYIDHLGGDVGDGAYAMLAGISSNLTKGELPLWNPYVWGGMTIVGMPTAQSFYPVTYLLYKICFNESVGMISYSAVVYVSFYIHLVIMVVGFYVLLRIIKFHRVVAFAVASLAAFSGCGIRLWGWSNLFSSLAYIPWFLGLIILMMNSEEKKKLVYSALAGIVLGLAGLASTSHGSLMLIEIFAVTYFAFMWNFRRDKKSIIQNTGCSFLTGVIGIGIMSISLLPFVEFLGDAYRYLGDAVIDGQAKPLYDDFIFHSTGMEDVRNIVGSYWGWLSLGIVLVVFVLMGFFCKVKDSKAVYWTGVSLTFFGLLYTGSLYVTNIVFYIPFINQIREPYLYCCFFCIGVVIVSAYGLNALMNMEKGERFSDKFYNPAGLFICCVLMLFSALFPQKFTWKAFLTICGIVLLAVIIKVVPRYKQQIIASAIIILLVGMEFSTFRNVFSARGKYTVDDAVKSVSQINLNALRLLDEEDLPSDKDSWRLMQWNTSYQAYPENVWSVWGYNDEFASMNPMPNGAMNIHLNWGLDKRAALSNTRYIICTNQEEETFFNWFQELGFQEIKRVGGIIPDYDATEDVEAVVFENENRKGNAWLVDNWIEYSEGDDVEELNAIINSAEFKPFETALVNVDTSDKQLNNRYGHPENASLTMTEYNANSVKFQVDASEDVLMITSEMIAPGWEVYIDGKKGDILEVNTAFRGCVVPSGEHVIEYRYLPKSFVAGCILAGISLLAVAGICVGVFLTSKKQKKG